MIEDKQFIKRNMRTVIDLSKETKKYKEAIESVNVQIK